MTYNSWGYEREVLFFPFSSFEIKTIKDAKFENEKIYEIRLLYLGKYLKKIENDKELINKATNLPESDFKTQLIKFGLIKLEKIKDIISKVYIIAIKNMKRKLIKKIK